MLSRLTPFVVCSCVGLGLSLVSSALAAPVTLDRKEAVAEPRRDVGTGICGSVTKFVDQPAPLLKIDEAVALLNKATGDPNIAARVARLFQNLNFTAGPGSQGDFYPPGHNEEPFPYCQDPNANPMSGDDNNIALRIRGYLNVPTAMGGQPQTFAVKCDDGCALRIGKSRQLVAEANDDSPVLTGRRARSVIFTDPGLYPIELVYYQNATTGYLEWSRALKAVFSGDDISVDNNVWNQNKMAFKPLAGVELYSAVVGTNAACIECGDNAPAKECSVGNFCGDGLCQPCNMADHCGAMCVKCAGDRPICSAGKCVQCTNDTMCGPGASCDIPNGTCLPPMPCTTSAQCKAPQVCRPEGFCGNPPAPCRTDAECLTGEICACADHSPSCAQKVCVVPPIKCLQDTDCPENFHCDTAAQICKLNDRYLYQGGLVGCSQSSTAPTSSGTWPWLAALGFLFLRSRPRGRRAAFTSR